jgi:GTP-binding nuclear protein Ran
MGPAKVGKSAFLKRWCTGEFEKEYLPVANVEFLPIDFNTTEGMIRLNVWDCSGKPELRGLRNAYLNCADAAILMFDLTNIQSFEELKQYQEDVENRDPDMPVVICGNKVDCEGRKVGPVNTNQKDNVTYYSVSAKSNYNFEKPWLWLLQELTGIPRLAFFDPEIDNESKPDEEVKDSGDVSSDELKTQIQVINKQINKLQETIKILQDSARKANKILEQRTK